MELVLLYLLSSCVKCAKALAVTNSTVQIVLAICGSLVGIVLIAVLLCCCCIYWYSKKQDLNGISESTQPRRRQPLRPVRTVTPGFTNNGISMADFEYLHQQSRQEYAGLPSQIWRDAPSRFHWNRPENSNRFCTQPNDSFNNMPPPPYSQTELNHQRHREGRGNSFLDARWEPSASETENDNETTRNNEQSYEHVRPGMETDLEEGTPLSTTTDAGDIMTGSEQQASEQGQTASNKTSSGGEIPLSLDAQRDKVEINGMKTSADIFSEEFPRITRGKDVRVIKVEDSDQTKKIKRISLAKRLKTEVIRPKHRSMDTNSENSPCNFSRESSS